MSKHILFYSQFFVCFLALAQENSSSHLPTSSWEMLINQAWIDRENKEFDKTLEVIFDIQEKNENSEEEFLLARYNLIIGTYIDLKLFDKAKKEVYKFYNQYKKINSKKAKSQFHYGLFQIKFQEKDYTSAIAELNTTISNMDSEKQQLFICGRLNDIGICFQKNNQYEQAKKYFLKANDQLDRIFETTNREHWNIKFAIRDNIAENVKISRDYSTAIHLLTRTVEQTDSLEQLKQHTFDYRRIRSLVRAADIALLEKQPELAYKRIIRVFKLMKKTNVRFKMYSNEMSFLVNRAYRDYLNFIGSYFEAKKYDVLLNEIREEQQAASEKGLVSLSRRLIVENTKKHIQNQRIKENEIRLKNEVLNKRFILAIGFLLSLSFVLLFLVQFRRRKAERQREKGNLIAAKFEIEQLKVQELSTSLELKQRNLQQLALGVDRQNSLLRKLFELSKKMTDDDGQKVILSNITEELKKELSLDQGKMQMEKQMELISNNFWHKVSQRSPELSPLNKELCAQLAMNLSNKQIALLRGVSPDSVTTAKMRLRKKMNFKTNSEMVNYLKSVSI